MLTKRLLPTPATVLVVIFFFYSVSIGSAAWAVGLISLPGITFSEASGNFRLLAATGSGRLEDPFIVIKEVFGKGEVLLSINVYDSDFGSRIESMHAVGFALQKVVINQTRKLWDHYALEPEFEAGQGSDYYDGLSFGQKSKVNRPFRSDRFAWVEDLAEPRDVIRFSQGEVKPGERVRFTFANTHTQLTPGFFLVQHVLPPYAQLDDNLDLPIKFAACCGKIGRLN